MFVFWLEIVVVLFLILANGFFAAAELAIVSVRRGRIGRLADQGHEQAKIVEALQSDPHRFLATVQIGVTLVGTMASAVGGAAAVNVIKPLLLEVPVASVRDAAEPLALFLVVGFITYFSLVFGELVPKALALKHAERMALAVARPIRFLSRVGGAAIFVLTLSSRAVLALLGIRGEDRQAFITREEIQQLVAEGRDVGEVSPREQELIRNVFEFSQTPVREVMVPRPRIVALDLDRNVADNLQVVLEGRFSRYPVFRGEVENILGFIHAKDLLGQAVREQDGDLASLVREPLFVPETKKVNDLLRQMQRRHLHMAMVVDEYGVLSGIVTTEDLLEELVGEIEDEHDLPEARHFQRLENGSYLVDAFISLADLEPLLDVQFADRLPFDTLAGLILFELGHLPVEGERLAWGDFMLTCVKVDRTAIQTVRIEPVDRTDRLQGE